MNKISWLLNFIFVFIIICFIFEPKNIGKNFESSDGLVGIQLENEEGKYIESKSRTWPSNKEYHFNKTLSMCENGSTLSWKNNKIVMNTKTSDKCYAYFDNNKIIKDLSGNNNDGIGYASFWNEDGITTSDDSQKGYVDCGLVNTDFSKGITLIARVRVNEFISEYYKIVMGFWNTLSNGGGIYLANNYVCFDLYNVDGISQAKGTCSSIEILPGEWYSFVGTYDNDTLKLYIIKDGKIIETKSWVMPGQIPNNITPIYLGVRTNTNQEFFQYGYHTYKYVLIYNRGIDESEVLDFTTEANPQNKENLLVWYNF